MTPIWAPFGAAFTFRAPVVKTASTNFAVQADWGVSGSGPAAGDVKVIKDGASIANITTLPVIYSTSYAWAFSLSAAEMSADEIIVQVVNRTYLTDQMFRIITLPQGAVRSRLAQAGASTTITLDTGATATDALYNGNIVSIIAGTGAGQNKVITGYVGSTRVATVDSAWAVTPDATSVFALFPQGIIGLTSSQVEAAVMDTTAGIETGLTFRQSVRLASAVLFGRRSGTGSGTEVFNAAVTNAKARVTGTIDGNGNRTNVTTDAT
jgi:hypothetical protein